MAEYPQHHFGARAKPFNASTDHRLKNFTSGYYAPFNLSTQIEHLRSDDPAIVQLTVWSPGKGKNPKFQEAVRALETDGRPARKGMEFGPTWSNHWFKVVLDIPEKWRHHDNVVFEWDSGGEALIFDEYGQGLQGFTGGAGIDLMNGGTETDRRSEYIIPMNEILSGRCVRYIESSCNDMIGIGGTIDPPDEDKYWKLFIADLVVHNKEARKLQADFQTLVGLTEHLPPQSPLGSLARVTANQMMNVFDRNDPKSVGKARKVAEKVLGKGWERELANVRGDAGADKGGNLWALGHCHIDTAWLWPWNVTKKKVARSWSAQCHLMERYPEHRFAASSAQQYAWLEEEYPEIFERVQEKVAEGKFEPAGATWLEHDANMLSGESFCRQFILGQAFFESRFGKRCDVYMLPDTFGYSAALPQIARLSGCKYFFTQKISWNQQNTFPLTTFNWVGLDGSQLLTHMTPVVNYNSQCKYDDIIKAYKNHQNLSVSPDSMIFYGLGDGGGGPTFEMLERLNRARAVAMEHDPKGAELPVVKMGNSMLEYFEHVDKTTEGGETLPSWVGELYLEVHRGTYTSQASTKRGNRKGEILMREVELACTLASLHSSKYVYPQKTITRCWEAICLCQFHDTLPGSSIAICVVDSDGKYSELQAVGRRLLDEAYAVLYGTASPTKENKGNAIVINTLHGVNRREVLAIQNPTVVPAGSNVRARKGAQMSSDGTRTFVLVESIQGAPCSNLAEGGAGDVKVKTSGENTILANETMMVTLEKGRIVSVYDVQLKREVIPKGKTAGFVIYEDHPADWDAWDVDPDHLEKATELSFTSVEVVENGPIRGQLKCELAFGKSKGSVLITLDSVTAAIRSDSRSMIRFDVDIDWQESHRFLKFVIPTTINSDHATYDAAFGIVRRPTHRNTSWDAAKFEVCAHKFADLSEYGYGLAIINDSKYGYAVQGNVMRLSLLRAPLKPDPGCDVGRQRFSFALLPHTGTYQETEVQHVAHAFNAPLHVRSVPSTAELSPLVLRFPFIVEGARNVMLETVKRGEQDGPGVERNVVLRLHEHLGGSANVRLRIRGVKVVKAAIVNILEDEIEDLPMQPQDEFSLPLAFRAFEVKTIRLTLAGGAVPGTPRPKYAFKKPPKPEVPSTAAKTDDKEDKTATESKNSAWNVPRSKGKDKDEKETDKEKEEDKEETRKESISGSSSAAIGDGEGDESPTGGGAGRKKSRFSEYDW